MSDGAVAMLYAIIGWDQEDSLAQRREQRPRHLERLEALRAEGRLVLAGPMPAVDAEDPGEAGFAGSLVVAEFNDVAEADAWARSDPYMTAGVYREVTVRPFRKVLP